MPAIGLCCDVSHSEIAGNSIGFVIKLTRTVASTQSFARLKKSSQSCKRETKREAQHMAASSSLQFTFAGLFNLI